MAFDNAEALGVYMSAVCCDGQLSGLLCSTRHVVYNYFIDDIFVIFFISASAEFIVAS